MNEKTFASTLWRKNVLFSIKHQAITSLHNATLGSLDHAKNTFSKTISQSPWISSESFDWVDATILIMVRTILAVRAFGMLLKKSELLWSKFITSAICLAWVNSLASLVKIGSSNDKYFL